MARAGRDDSDGNAGGARKSKRRGRSPGIRRLIAAGAFMPLAGRAPLYARLIWSLIGDVRVPVARKALLGGALGYVVLGRDIVPDRVPILGQLDDLVIVALAIELFVDGLDEALLDEKLVEVGIPRAAYDEDVARVRRLVPGPVRRVVRRIPGGIRLVADAVAQSGAPTQLRRWIGRDAEGESKNGRGARLVEGSIA
jgi:uncharacterized membrane protein YkvA (DUF1232 family)